MTSETPAVHDNPSELRYELLVDGQLAGFAQYRLSNDRITMFHTEYVLLNDILTKLNE